MINLRIFITMEIIAIAMLLCVGIIHLIKYMLDKEYSKY